MTEEVKIDYKKVVEILVPALTEAFKVIAAGTPNGIDDQIATVLDKIADSIYPPKSELPQ